ncbi:5-(carboxyamino)imidazole ribonucleotide mutase [Candidatus Foliamicus sp.]
MSKKVAILMGSHSDWKIMEHSAVTLDKLGIAWEARALSAHRAPKLLAEYIEQAEDNDIAVIIAGAGLAAALPGTAAALTSLPVLGVPLATAAFGGADAMLSMAQMPAGVPVGTLGVGRHGAVNAALLATAILAIGDADARTALKAHREAQTAEAARNSDVAG